MYIDAATIVFATSLEGARTTFEGLYTINSVIVTHPKLDLEKAESAKS